MNIGKVSELLDENKKLLTEENEVDVKRDLLAALELINDLLGTKGLSALQISKLTAASDLIEPYATAENDLEPAE